MDKNNIIILALIIIVVTLLIGIFAMIPNTNKQSTNLTFYGNSTINEGDSIEIKLTDNNGTPISNQTVNVSITDKDKFSDYHSVVTNEKGVGILKLDKNSGEYEISISFSGNDKYNGCNATKKITIEEKVVEEPVEVEVESSSSSNERSGHYSPQFNRVVYDDEELPIPD